MKKYECTICGYIYDESVGIPESSIAPGTKWDELPDDWECPLCGASKSAFEAQEEKSETKPITKDKVMTENHDLTELSFGEMSALFSNLAKGSEKQYRLEDAERFGKLADFYNNFSEAKEKNQLSVIDGMVEENISVYADAKAVAEENKDRGALRALVWGEKVTRIISSILKRYDRQKSELLKDKKIYVCEICGFVYIGDEKPELCPVCKVPKLKISEIKKETI